MITKPSFLNSIYSPRKLQWIDCTFLFQASSSDPSSPSTPTTRKNLYLPVRRPSLLESVLHMTKEISTNKSTNSSHDSPTNYPENESTESSYEKKTVITTTKLNVFVLVFLHQNDDLNQLLSMNVLNDILW